MDIKHFDIKPQYGYHEMAECESEQRRIDYAILDHTLREQGRMSEADFERDCFLSILTDIKRRHVNMLELGAGWGRMCMALAGIIDFKIVPIIPSSYFCLAVEAEPTHYQWIKDHFTIQHIRGMAIHGAVSNKIGNCYFDTSHSPDSCYGQAINPISIFGIRNIITKRAVKVPTYTVDCLIDAGYVDHMNIVDVDVQGAECKVIEGAVRSIKKGLIDYWLIGTHHKDLNDALRRILCRNYDLVVNIYPNTVATVDGFNPIDCHDGIQLYKRL